MDISAGEQRKFFHDTYFSLFLINSSAEITYQCTHIPSKALKFNHLEPFIISSTWIFLTILHLFSLLLLMTDINRWYMIWFSTWRITRKIIIQKKRMRLEGMRKEKMTYGKWQDIALDGVNYKNLFLCWDPSGWYLRLCQVKLRSLKRNCYSFVGLNFF